MTSLPSTTACSKCVDCWFWASLLQNYDIVNTGREVLAQLITTFEQQLTTAVGNGDKAAATKVGNTLLEAYSDLDELVVTKQPTSHAFNM